MVGKILGGVGDRLTLHHQVGASGLRQAMRL
jgi:hypothetical protein